MSESGSHYRTRPLLSHRNIDEDMCERRGDIRHGIDGIVRTMKNLELGRQCRQDFQPIPATIQFGQVARKYGQGS